MEPETRRRKVQYVKEFNRAHPRVLPALIGIALYVLLGYFLWGFISPEDAIQKKDFAQLMAQIAGGLALLFGLYFTWRRVEISQRTLETQQDQQVTERFTRAIEQLGATDDKTDEPKIELRLGGIYALERIAKDSPKRDYATIMEVLTAYVRENASLPSEAPSEPLSERNDTAEESKNAEQSLAGAPQEKPRADIQAVLDVLGRREENRVPKEYHVRLDLSKTNLSGAILTKTNLSNAILQGANLTKAKLGGSDLTKINLREANLKEANLRETNLERANLQDANLQDANLVKAKLLKANLQDANLQDANLLGANLQGAVPWRANLTKAALGGADLTKAHLGGAILRKTSLWGANFREAFLLEANLQEANLERANLQEANLERAILKEANLQEANLEGANLERANLREANLQEANLEEVNLTRAILQEANLQEANLGGANLREAILAQANLTQANLQEVDLTQAILTGADLSHVKDVIREDAQEQLEKAIGDETTKLPIGLYSPASWTQGQDKETDGKE